MNNKEKNNLFTDESNDYAILSKMRIIDRKG